MDSKRQKGDLGKEDMSIEGERFEYFFKELLENLPSFCPPDYTRSYFLGEKQQTQMCFISPEKNGRGKSYLGYCSSTLLSPSNNKQKKYYFELAKAWEI